MPRTQSQSVLSRSTTPPGSPATGDAYFVIATASGAWTGKESKVAQWNGSSWLFRTPSAGDQIYSVADALTYTWSGSGLAAGGSGDVVGPGSSANNKLAAFADSTGKLLKDAGVYIDAIPTAQATADAAAAAIVAGTGAGVLSPSQITADQNDYAPTGHATAAMFRLSTDAARNLTGLAGGAAGRVVRIHNVGSNDLTLKDESASSTGANRFALAADLVLKADHGVELQYDSTTTRWRVARSLTPEALGGTGRTAFPHVFALEFYASSALAAGSSLRGILNTTDTTCAFAVPSGKTLKVVKALGYTKNGATAGTYNDDLILRNVTDSTDAQVATNTGAANAEVEIQAEGTLDAPLATLAAGKRFAAGLRNRSGNPGAWDASYKHHVILVCVLE